MATAALGTALLASCAAAPETAPTVTTTTAVETSAAPVASLATTTTAPVAVQLRPLPAAPPVTGEAPVRLAVTDLPVSYLDYAPRDPETAEPRPPDEFTVELNGCSTAGPGVVVFDLTLPDTSAYPVETVAGIVLFAGDMGTGIDGTVTFEQGGRQLLVASLPDQMRPYELEEGGLHSGSGWASVERRPQWAIAGMQCSLGLGPGIVIQPDELTVDPMALATTAPVGTIEQLAQAAYGEGDEAALLPLAIAYGEAVRFYSDVWFIPEHPDRLQSIDESLHRDGCLELESVYAGYTILQSMNCPSPPQSGLWQVGGNWFAAGGDGTRAVTVSGTDESLVADTFSSLGAYRHLFSRGIPIEPVGETVMGRAPFGDGEVLVTFGVQRCSDSSCGPEYWFYVYHIENGALEQFADYPAYGDCLFAEEEEFVLAVAPRFGSILVDGPASSDVITADEDSNPFFFASTENGPISVTVLDENGNEPPCIAQSRADGRGGIEPPPVTTTAAPVASRTVVAKPCTHANPMPAVLTDQDPIHQACVDTEFGEFTLSLVVPNAMLVDPPDDDLRCLVEQRGDETGAGCSAPEGPFIPVVSGSDDYRWLSTLVPDGTTRIVAVTSHGVELVGIPYDSLAMTWWLPAEGELRQVTAETDNGPVSLYSTD